MPWMRTSRQRSHRRTRNLRPLRRFIMPNTENPLCSDFWHSWVEPMLCIVAFGAPSMQPSQDVSRLRARPPIGLQTLAQGRSAGLQMTGERRSPTPERQFDGIGVCILRTW